MRKKRALSGGGQADRVMNYADGLPPGGVIVPVDVAKATGLTLQVAQGTLVRLAGQGRLVRVDRGKYQIPGAGVEAAQKAKQLEMPLGAGVLQVTLQCLKIIRKLPPNEQTMALAFLREAI